MNKQLYDALIEKGFPKDFCEIMVNKYLVTDYTSNRMLGYLYRYSNPRIEDVVDEMLAILSDRNAIIEKKQMEEAQGVINQIYNRGLENL